MPDGSGGRTRAVPFARKILLRCGSAPMRRCRKVAAWEGWVSRVEDASVARACPASHETVSGRGLAKARHRGNRVDRFPNSRRWQPCWESILRSGAGSGPDPAVFRAPPGNTLRHPRFLRPGSPEGERSAALRRRPGAPPRSFPEVERRTVAETADPRMTGTMPARKPPIRATRTIGTAWTTRTRRTNWTRRATDRGPRAGTGGQATRGEPGRAVRRRANGPGCAATPPGRPGPPTPRHPPPRR